MKKLFALTICLTALSAFAEDQLHDENCNHDAVEQVAPVADEATRTELANNDETTKLLSDAVTLATTIVTATTENDTLKKAITATKDALTKTAEDVIVATEEVVTTEAVRVVEESAAQATENAVVTEEEQA